MKLLHLLTLLLLAACTAAPTASTAPATLPQDAARTYDEALATVPSRSVVYVIDHSGDTLDTYDYLRNEIKSTLLCLRPIDRFAIIMYTAAEQDQTFPADLALTPATDAAKRGLADFMDQTRASAGSATLRTPAGVALKKAFSLQPDLIYFLAAGPLDPKLSDDVKALNPDKKTHVFTVAFVNVPPETEELLKNIAADSGSKFKYVHEKDLTRPAP